MVCLLTFIKYIQYTLLVTVVLYTYTVCNRNSFCKQMKFLVKLGHWICAINEMISACQVLWIPKISVETRNKNKFRIQCRYWYPVFRSVLYTSTILVRSLTHIEWRLSLVISMYYTLCTCAHLYVCCGHNMWQNICNA